MDVPYILTLSPELSGCPSPPRIQEKTWRIGGVLTGFLMSNLDETFTKASKGYFLLSDTFSRFIRNLHVLLTSKEGLKGHVES